MSTRPWIFISPASRGIGHALARHLLRTTGLPVVATARSDLDGVRASILWDLRVGRNNEPASASTSPSSRGEEGPAGPGGGKGNDDTGEEDPGDVASRLHVLGLDVTDERTVAAAAAEAAALFPPPPPQSQSQSPQRGGGGGGPDNRHRHRHRHRHRQEQQEQQEQHWYHMHLGFALPGILRPERSPAQVEYAAALETLRVNMLGPLMLMKHFGDFLPRGGGVGDDDDDDGDVDDDGWNPDYGIIRNASSSSSSSSFPPVSVPSPSPGRGGGGGQRRGEDTEENGKEYLRLPRHATFVTASARVGSVSDNRLGGWYSYRASKAGVNSLAKTFDLHLRNRGRGRGRGSGSGSGSGNSGKEGAGAGDGVRDGAMAIAYHPGTVRTGLSREFWGSVPPDRLFSAEFAAERLVEVVRTRTLADRGRCWDWKGEEVPP